MKSRSPDCSCSASDSPRISGRDPSTHKLHSASAMPAQSCCHAALTAASKSLPLIPSRELLLLPDEKCGDSEFQGDAGRQQTGFVFLGARTPQFAWQKEARFPRTFDSTLPRAPSPPQRSSRPVVVRRLAGNKLPGPRSWRHQPDAPARRPAASRAGLSQRPSLARRVGMAGLLCPGIDAIARNRSILG